MSAEAFDVEKAIVDADFDLAWEELCAIGPDEQLMLARLEKMTLCESRKHVFSKRLARLVAELADAAGSLRKGTGNAKDVLLALISIERAARSAQVAVVASLDLPGIMKDIQHG